MRHLPVFLAGALALAGIAIQPSSAQEPNVWLGRTYAQQLCSDCHAVGPDKTTSPAPAAPSFRRIANTPGMTSIALSAWMYSMHPSMPNIVLKPEQGEHIFAYIQSLRTDEE